MCTSKIIGHFYIIAILQFLLMNSFEVYFISNFTYKYDISSFSIALQAVVLLVVKIHLKLTKTQSVF